MSLKIQKDSGDGRGMDDPCSNYQPRVQARRDVGSGGQPRPYHQIRVEPFPDHQPRRIEIRPYHQPWTPFAALQRTKLSNAYRTKERDTKLEYVRSLLLSDAARPLRFVCIGGLAGLMQLFLLSLFTRLGWQELLANTIAYILSAQVNFVLSMLFTWHDRQGDQQGDRQGDRQGLRVLWAKKTMLKRWLTFHSSIIGTGLLNMLVFVVGRSILPSLLASALGIVCAAIANFFLFNRFVFRKSIASSETII